MKNFLSVSLVGFILIAASPTLAQTAANTDAALDATFGAHKPYRNFFEKLQHAVASDDKAAVAALIDYPFQARINDKAMKLRDPAHFIADYGKIVTPKVKETVAKQDYGHLFANWQGVMLGDGEV